ncbi:MAG: hypothetical protein KC416_11580, partial [Myxococcales bacterium]|nr:hypothetical protein [Myxococcales bacterium]
MRAILYIYLTHLLGSEGLVGDAAKDAATHTYHLFAAGVYALPIVGAIIADRLLGKYHTILWLSIVYCLGHVCLAVFEDDISGFRMGLVLIAVGSGGIKPCVSAHVGDQFGKGNWHLIERVYQAFYFIINFGSFFATLAIPWVKEAYGPAWAFGIPGILMAIATFFFWMGRHVFVHVPPRPGGKLGLIDTISGTLLFFSIGSLMFFGAFSESYAELSWALKGLISVGFLAAGLTVFAFRQSLAVDDGFLSVLFYAFKVKVTGREDEPLPSAIATEGAPDSTAAVTDHWLFGPAVRRFGAEIAEGPWAVLKITTVFLMVSVFWALFDQHGSSWVRQATDMDRTLEIFGSTITVLPSQVQAANPLLVMMLVPLFGLWGYGAVEKLTRVTMTPLRRMTLGMFVASTSFVVVALIQERLDAGVSVHIAWQLVAYLLITAAEVMVSVTGLEFAYTQAPRRMKSTIMGFWLLCISLGNELVALLAGFQGLPLATFFWIFAGLMALAAVLFGARASFYTYQDYSQ